MLPHSLTNLETQKYYQNEPKFNSLYSRNNLLNTEDGANVINLDEYESIRISFDNIKKIYCVYCKNYKKFKNPEILYLLYKTLVIEIGETRN